MDEHRETGGREAVAVQLLRLAVRPGAEEAYDAAHADVPPEVLASLHRSGFHDLQIFRDGTDLFAVVLTPAGVDPETLVDPRPTPAVADWETRMAALQAPARADGPPEWIPLRRVFGLREQLGQEADGSSATAT